MALDLSHLTAIPTPAPTRHNANVYLFVSIYLLLFAFFVVLNALSNQNAARVEAVIGSVNATFKPQNQPRSALVDLIARDDRVVGNDEFPDRVFEMFESPIDIPGYGASRDGNLLRITLETAYLFDPLEPGPRRDRAPFLDRLAVAMVQVPTGLRNEVQVWFGIGAELPAPAALADHLAIRRAGALAVQLQARGITAEALTVGVRRGDPGILLLSFATRPRTRPATRPPTRPATRAAEGGGD